MKRLVVLIVFILIGLSLYFNSLRNPFHYDDEHHIVWNPYIQTVSNIPLFFTEPRTFSIRQSFHAHYRPLLLTSYAINHYFGGLAPKGFHLGNLGFHISSAFLVFLIVQAMLNITPTLSLPHQGGGKMVRRGGGKDRGGGRLFIPVVAGLLFLTTPFNSEVVNYITARSSVMCSFFYLLAFYFWVRYREFTPTLTLLPPPFSPSPSSPGGGAGAPRLPTGGGGKRWGGRLGVYFYIASFLSFILAMLTKEIAITLPVMLWLYDVYFVHTGVPLFAKNKGINERGFRWKDYLVYIPFLVAGIFIGFILRFLFFGQFNVDKDYEAGAQFLTATRVLVRYFIKVLIPTGLSIWHQVDPVVDWIFLVSLIGISCMIFFAYFGWRRAMPLWRVVSFFILWFFVVLLPTSVITLTAPFQENRGYLSGAGAVIITAIVLNQVRMSINHRRWANTLFFILLAGTIFIYSGGVFKRNQVWRNGLILWADVIDKYPLSRDAHINMGSLYNRYGRQDLAEKEYHAALTIDKEYTKAHTGLGILYFDKGEMDKAESHLKKALEENAKEPFIHTYLGKIYEARGDLDRAFLEYLTVFKYQPDDMSTPEKLVRISAQKGTLDVAYRNFSFLKEKDHDNPAVRRALGLIYQLKGNYELAIREYIDVLSMIPHHTGTLMDLGDIYVKIGKFSLGEDAFKRVLEIRPSYHKARINLAAVYEKERRLELAIAEYKKIIEKTSPEGENSPYYVEAQKRMRSVK